MFTKVKKEHEIEAMRESGRMLATVLDHLETKLEPGMSGLDLNDMAAREAKKLGGETPFLNYHGFPGVMCVSANDVIQHGIPTADILNAGDIVNLDFGIRYRGMITDSGRTLAVGGSSTPQNEKLLKDTKRALYAGIEQVRAGVRVGDISAAVQSVLDKGGYGIVRDLVGHGVGHELHEDPNIPNYGVAGKGPALKAGMTIAIEPMATLGDYHITIDDDNWTIRSVDGSYSAQFEHTVLITISGYEILTESLL